MMQPITSKGSKENTRLMLHRMNSLLKPDSYIYPIVDDHLVHESRTGVPIVYYHRSDPLGHYRPIHSPPILIRPLASSNYVREMPNNPNLHCNYHPFSKQETPKN